MVQTYFPNEESYDAVTGNKTTVKTFDYIDGVGPLYDVYCHLVFSADDMFVGGCESRHAVGWLDHYDGMAWSNFGVPDDWNYTTHLFGFSALDFWLVDTGSNIYRYAPIAVPPFTPAWSAPIASDFSTITNIWGTNSLNNMWLCGYDFTAGKMDMVVQSGGVAGGFADVMRKSITVWKPGADWYDSCSLGDIWGDGTGKIWTVGYVRLWYGAVDYRPHGEIYYYSGAGVFTLALNGDNGWAKANYVGSTGFTRAECVSGVDDSHVWAGGEEWLDTVAKTSYGFITFWDGATWAKQALPTIPYDFGGGVVAVPCGPILGINAFSATEVYAIGRYRSLNDPPVRFVLKFNGVAWSVLKLEDNAGKSVSSIGWSTGDSYSGAKIYGF